MKKLTKVLAVIATIYAIAYLYFYSRYQESQSQVDIYVGENGFPIYTHPDAETTHILDVITGMASLTPEEKFLMVKKQYARKLKSLRIDFPPDLLLMDFDTFVNFIEKEETKKYGSPQEPVRFRIFMQIEEYKKDVFTPLADYDKVWSLEMKYGAPKVRWATGFSRWPLAAHELHCTFYWPLTHTIYIEDESVTSFYNELAHARQIFESPFIFANRGIASFFRANFRTVVYGMSFNDAYLKEYDIEGTIENEAHKKIYQEFLEASQ
jgi:hypothetical protein